MSIPVATRVRDLNSRCERIGMVSGRVEHGAGAVELLPVIVEGTTRNEFWAVHRLAILPRARQLRPMGGKITPPRGYPLVPPKEFKGA